MGAALSNFENVAGFAPTSRPAPGAALGEHRDFVVQRRRMRASWSAIGGMLGVSEHLLRSTFDRDYEPPAGFIRSAVAALPAGVKRVRATAAAEFKMVTRAMILSVLARSPASTTEIAGVTGGDPKRISDTLQRCLEGGSAAFAGRPGQRDGRWALTERGASDVRAYALILARVAASPRCASEVALDLGLEGRRVSSVLKQLGRQGFVLSSGPQGSRDATWRVTETGRAKVSEARADG